ncbi:MAG: hypothetical protein ABIQ70_02505, partial [Dokdonella sp.]
MPKNRLEFKPGLIDGRDWSYYFDANDGAKVPVDGEIVGELSTAKLRQLLKIGDDSRDADLEADEVVRALELATF